MFPSPMITKDLAKILTIITILQQFKRARISLSFKNPVSMILVMKSLINARYISRLTTQIQRKFKSQFWSKNRMRKMV